MTLSQRAHGIGARVVRVLRRLVGSPDVAVDQREHGPGPLLSRPDGYEPIRAPLAGVAHRNRRDTVHRLALGELVWLRREPNNEFDSNAIAVETGGGHQLGYIGRNFAVRLAPHMDTRPDPLVAVVTELTSDISAGVVGAAVSFYLPAELVAELLGQAQRWEFCLDTSADGATYLMLNCDEAELTRVNEALQRRGLQWIRSGLSYGEAPDGRQYRWYIRLEGGPAEQTLDHILNDTLGTSRRYIDANKWIAEFDGEIDRLRMDNKALREENTTLRARLLKLQRATDASVRQQRTPRKPGLDVIVKTLLPRVILLRDSLDILERELESYEPVLRELRTLCWAPSDIRAERVERAPEWRERRFSTGQKDDGRLYFRQRDGTWIALVSFKKDQPGDVEYLKRS